MTSTDLEDLLRLEDQFADAMTRMYAVGNGLATLRARAAFAASAADTQARAGIAVPPPPVGATAVPARPAYEASVGTPAAPPPPVPASPAPASPVPASPVPAPSAAVPAPPALVPAPSAPSAPAGAPAVAAPGIPAVGHPDPSIVVPGLGAPPVAWWQREGVVVKLLGLAGAGVLLIGVALLLAFAIEHGYLGPAARVGGAAVLAVGLVGVAMRLHRTQSRAAGSVAIAAAGYATAYLDIVAATAIYRWLPPVIGLTLGALVAASGIVLARAWDRQFLALMTVGGVAALAPAVARGDHLLSAAFLVVLAMAAYPAHIGRDWYVLHLVRVLPAVIALVGSAVSRSFVSGSVAPGSAAGAPDRQLLALAVVLAAAELGTAVLASRIDARTGLLTPLLVASAFPLLVTAEPAGWDAWTVAAPAAVAYLLGAKLAGGVPVPQPILALAPWATAVGTGFAVVAIVTGARGHWAAPLLLVLACAYAAAAHVIPAPWIRWAALVVAVIALAGYLPTLPLVLDRDRISGLGVTDLVASALVVGLAVLLPPLVQASLATDPQHGGVGTTARLGLTWPLLLIGGGATVVTACVLAGRALERPAGGFVVGHGLATLLWAAGAAYLLMHGLRRSADATISVRIGLVLAAVAVGKLLLFDLAALDGLVRIAAFIGAGLALLAMGTGYAQALERTRAPR